jgi:hypothetical protein
MLDTREQAGILRLDAETLNSEARRASSVRKTTMGNSILEAVKMGLWDFLPHTVDYNELEASDATPGTREKLDILADHLRRDLPTWHVDDCLDDDRLDRKDPEDDWPRRRPR